MSSKNPSFHTTTHGKWILAGEHAVVRGHAALVFPLLDKALTLRYTPSTSAAPLQFTAQMSNHNQAATQSLLQKILEHGLQCVHRSISTIQGDLHIESNIPVGVGMGASAALCVAITRWFTFQQWIAVENEFTIARELEHFFHGQSSGLDIIGVSSKVGMYFQHSQASALTPTWSPNWQLSFCGQPGSTAHCVQSVRDLWAQHPDKGHQIDHKMQAAVLAAKHALEAPFTSESQTQLVHAIQQASDCFDEWGLITPALHQHMQDLRSQGALAVKPTGSGGGGYVVSLWEQDPA